MRVVAFLPSGVVSLLCGLVVLLFYLGLAGAVGLVVLGGIFVINVKVGSFLLLRKTYCLFFIESSWTLILF